MKQKGNRFRVRQHGARVFVYLVLSFIVTACSSVPPSTALPMPTADPVLLRSIQDAVTTESPEIIRDTYAGYTIPVVFLGDGSRMTAGFSPLSFRNESIVFITDLSDPLQVRGTADGTRYEDGRGVIIVEGRQIYVFGLSLPDGFDR